MINIYPANRLENLVFLLDRVMQTGSNHNILSEEIILVQSQGMQHWLNLKLAETRGISMNLSFSLPMAFFWNQIRAILGKDQVPEQSSYTREVLSWRIHDLLASEAMVNNPLCQEASQYWMAKNNAPNKNTHGGQSEASQDKRYQLACQLADLFEQYQIFRPDWLMAWQKGDLGQGGWQAFLWQLLIAQDPQHPVQLLRQAITSLKNKSQACHLPERISLFGINTLPQIWLEFLSELGEHTQVHFFHLNPCVEYWGDLKTDKAQAKEHFYRWLKSSDYAQLSHERSPALDEQDTISTNPILANLGSQGKDFLYLLQDHTSLEIPIYESPEDLALETGEQLTLLQSIQTDILNLNDARNTEMSASTALSFKNDDSICIASAHSALREIQALHDWLLHQINNDKELTPKDILVMCPNVENYAPYVDAVFAHAWNDWSEQVPPLPCSIADRTLKDSEPLVQAFSDLLDLPDSRFQVSQLLAYLRLPALQDKFSLTEADLNLLERWLKSAAIHWGLDASHKQQVLENKDSNDKFTWKYGLERLLLGFAHADQALIYQDKLLLPDVEGDEALLLGRYFELLEQLQYCARELQTARSAKDWQQFLLQIKDSLFSNISDDNNAQQIITQAIDDLGEYTNHAHYKQRIPLSIIRDFLSSHFSQAEPGRQFMAGQVTFCSMVPMRSVPFKIIAVLGLNDGEFPRQRQAMSFDLMAVEPPRKGDRSRRGDDRYLFLEAIISCRDKLYLSYQGHDIKTNNQREPSLVLNELSNYLTKGYGWESSERQLNVPLQAFNTANYQGQWQSFSKQWLKLSEPGELRNNLIEVNDYSTADTQINAEQLVRFFDNPCKQFAQQRLGLFFDEQASVIPEDSEPFVSNNLVRYTIQEEIISTALATSLNADAIEGVMQSHRLDGQLPDTPNTEQELEQWQQQGLKFSRHVQDKIQSSTKRQLEVKTVTITINNIQLQADLPLLGEHLFYWRLANPKPKDDIRLWIHHLIAQIELGETETHGLFRGELKDNEMAILTVRYSPLDASTAQELLGTLIKRWQQGMNKALLFDAQLGRKHCYIKRNAKNKATNTPLNNFTFAAFWQDQFQTQGMGSDPYINWFWGDQAELPNWEQDWQSAIEEMYAPLYANRQETTDHG
ncbi:exodeoxyribonuclease V subunit gamma [sulfur-oxidizing endosymbiont of Gigantopelta aegis]|uniref:exodeoxyribonuclease V subunit gamma n=1 Tax=sulfur-oxidizing endosymbiont of Gigantopelta aegis TaxID=2794934 RepID=UPI0018DE126D|nr:exodeoxyribonuclease V subunit gamma [sulfur-oxidizing endosymbiont of Gigantopelta aegis]